MKSWCIGRMIKNKKVLIAFYDSFVSCPRPKRLHAYLAQHNDVTIASKDFQPLSNVKNSFFFCRAKRSRFAQWIVDCLVKFRCLRRVVKLQLSQLITNLDDSALKEFDYVFVHDLALLPLFKSVSDKVIFDAREFYPLMFTNETHFKVYEAPIWHYMCQQYLPLFPCKITVSDGVAKKYQDIYKQDFFTFPSFPLKSLADRKSTFSALKPTDKIRIIYHGAAHKDRDIEKLIALGDCLDSRYELHLMLKKADPFYYEEIKERVANVSGVKLLPPVKFEHIIEFISTYDIGIHMLENTENQHSISLPNKFFEYIAAGLMLITAGSKEMYSFIKSHNLGMGFETKVPLDDLARHINSLTCNQIDSYKHNNQKASEQFVFEHIAEGLFEHINHSRSI